ncbi:MAG: diguanylate cyclase [Lachnospiraceae bacterium]|nr:diguanylate cyclase [Lachnospiraceae bacterium]
MKKIITIFLIILTICLFPSSGLEASANEPAKIMHILFLSSYNYSYPIVPDQLEGFNEGLGTLTCDIEYEFMDAKKFNNSNDLNNFYSYLKYKMSHTGSYDLIVVSDDNAFQFWKKHRTNLFRNVPLVFLGINNISEGRSAANDKNITGILEIEDFKRTFEVIEQLFPSRKHIVAVVDGSVTGNGQYALFMENADNYEGLEFSVINTGDYSKEGLKKTLSDLDNNCVIINLDFYEDADGNYYNERTSSSLIYENAPNVPVFKVSSARFGSGLLGGAIYSHYESGKKAGEMVAEIAEGKPISEIEVIDDIFSVYIFDQNVMDKFHINKSRLPADSTILNEHWSLKKFYTENVILANLIIVIIIVLIIFIAFLLLSNYRREKITKEDFLTKMPNRLFINEKLKSLVEKKEPFGLVMMDVDHFKSINDTMGHPIGDELLISVAKRLKEMSTSEFLIARIGGDEFMAIILGSKIASANMMCQTLMTNMKMPHSLSNGPLRITVSIGCALYPEHTDDPSKVMKLADIALYNIKERGRDGYEIYTPDDKNE